MKKTTRSSFAALLTTLTCVAALLALVNSARAVIGTAYQMQLGNPSGAIADPNNHSHYLLQRAVESMDYNDSLGEPNWVSWDLTAADVGSANRSGSFYTDTNLPATFYRVAYADYTHSGFDRGHMCPSEDRTDTTNDNKMVFFMSNIVPQYADLNQGPWEALETLCRNFTTSNYEVLIMSGPYHFSGTKINTNGPVYVPDYTWKIIVPVAPGTGTVISRITTSTRVICVKMPNVTGIRNVPWTTYITSVNQIQSDTGFTFFTALDPAIAAVLRAKVDGASAPSITSFSPGSGSVGTSVTLTGTHFTGASQVAFNGTAASFTVNSDTSITATVPSGASTGVITVTAPGGLATSATSFTVNTAVPIVVISQVYGGGGNSGATYKNDFIELYNRGTATADLSTYAVQYTSAAGSTWSETTLSGTLAAGHYYLIQEAAGTGGTVNLPTPQAVGSISMSATAGKVALTKTTTLLTVDNPLGNGNVVDFIGYGTADCWEGAGAAAAPSNTTADLRAGSGGTDSNNNNTDFATGSPNPRNF